MPVDPLIEEHWPQLAALHRALEGLPDTVTVAAPAGGDGPLHEHEIDRIHEGLLRKKRSGRLGLND